MQTFIEIILAFILAIPTAFWVIHIAESKWEGYIYGWASYRKFKKEFGKHQWSYSRYGREVTLKCKKSRIEFSDFPTVVMFDGKIMILSNPISHFLCYRLISKNIKKYAEPRRKPKKIKW